MTIPYPVPVRDAAEADLAAICSIYAYYVLNTAANFEAEPPTREEMGLRRENVLRAGLPYLVAEVEGQVRGYAYASLYRPRAAYRYTLENSIYIEQGFQARGIGTALLSALIERCEAGPWRQMIAVIGDDDNQPSIRLHQRFGFQHVGTLNDVGFKFGRWIDTVIMQRALGDGSATPPDSR
jgi:L-amino acid N-acyltransferase YncA